MPTTTYNTTTDSGIDIDNTTEYELDSIGIEFEYPVVDHNRTIGGRRSGSLYNDYGGLGTWYLDGWDDAGMMTSDHVGAEITSPILNFHSSAPSDWYRDTIAEAEERGYPFAATGSGATNFGLHLHLSELPQEKAHDLFRIATSSAGMLFFCASLDEHTADPWRHGGVPTCCVNNPDAPLMDGYFLNHYSRGRDNNHYEFRLPEPCAPEHFDMMIEFLRVLERQGGEAAAGYVREKVLEANENLSVVQQYERLHEENPEWPTEDAMRDGSYTDEDNAQVFKELIVDHPNTP